MNSLGEFAGSFCQFLWRNSWQSSVLMVLVLGANWSLRKKLSPAWRHGLWLLVFVRLAWPYAPPSQLSVFNLLAQKDGSSFHVAASVETSFTAKSPQPDKSAAMAVVPAPVNTSQAVTEQTQAPGLTPGLMDRLPRTSTVLFFAWLAGVMILAGRVLWEAGRLANSIRHVRPITESTVLNLLEDCKQMMNVTTPLVVIESAYVKSPVLHGFIRPRLVLPPGMIASLSEEALCHVFLHELAHMRRRDILVNWGATGLLIVHWCNPLVWLAFWQMRNERELAADSLVLSRASIEKTKYGETLLSLAQFLRGRTYLPSLAGIIQVRAQVVSRIAEIMNFGSRTQRPALAFIVFLCLAVATLTDARVPRDISGQVQREAGQWRPCASVPAPFAPLARRGHTATWTSKEWIVWGGRSDVYLNDGARYDPVADAWRPMSQTNAPSARWFHAAVWTGTEVIIWGGRSAFDSFEIKGDGARYDPATDTWTPLSHVGAPNGRSQMATVWTGSEMLIWGGSGEGWINEPAGGRYDPRTDSWRALSQNGSPESRMGLTAIWTGSEMLVWGGISYSPDRRVFATGGRYDPARDSWTLLPTNDAPTARTMHTAVWTGSEMIIWGGHEDSDAMNTGARFNVASGKWTPTTLKEAPQARFGHCAVWTGSEMIAWGGMTGARNMTLTGSRYDAVANKWEPLTNLGAPAARFFHGDEGAVWIGAGMLIFGGSIITKELDTIYLWTPGRMAGVH
jgi:beta-lactamase regulating signal transducer with metallopeptidase domain/N-acetylneuraminic acid mutarotase